MELLNIYESKLSSMCIISFWTEDEGKINSMFISIIYIYVTEILSIKREINKKTNVQFKVMKKNEKKKNTET